MLPFWMVREEESSSSSMFLSFVCGYIYFWGLGFWCNTLKLTHSRNPLRLLQLYLLRCKITIQKTLEKCCSSIFLTFFCCKTKLFVLFCTGIIS
jgi:hypothetical protein